MNEQDLARFFEVERKQSQRERYTLAHSGKHRVKDDRRNLANDIEAEAASRLVALGFHVMPQSHKSHFDLLAIADDGALRVEVKASRWDGERYQFNLRDNRADVFLFGCLDGDLRWFVIPADRVKGKTVVKVTAHHPADYIGRLTSSFEAWDTLPDLARTARNPYQPELWQKQGVRQSGNSIL